MLEFARDQAAFFFIGRGSPCVKKSDILREDEKMRVEVNAWTCAQRIKTDRDRDSGF